MKESPELLLISCPMWDVSRPPINLGYLATFMRSRGFSVGALDLSIKFYNALLGTPLPDLWEVESINKYDSTQAADLFFVKAPELIERYLNEILESDARYLGFSVHMRNVDFTERMVGLIRSRDPERVILYGGTETTISNMSGTLGRLHADAYVIGEGEETLFCALETHKKKGRFEPMPGLVINEGGRLSEYIARPPIQNLDDIPFPTYEDFNLKEYRPREGRANLPFLFSRGCVFKCHFCMDHAITGCYRTRSPEHCVSEFTYHIEKYGVRIFWFTDLLCNGNPKSLERLCDTMLEEGLNIRWWSYAAIHKGLSSVILDKMKRTGCQLINFGMESGSDRVLKMMNKSYDSSTAEEVLRRCSRAGIQTTVNIIVGFPGETRAEHRETMAFLLRNRDYIDRVSNLNSLMPTPNSYLGNHLDEFGIRYEKGRPSWSAGDGNDPAERRRRMLEVRRLCLDAGITLDNFLGERGWSEEAMKNADKKERPKSSVKMTITDVRLFDASDRECGEFETHDHLSVAIRFHTQEPVEDPLFRVQIHNNENRGRHEILMFGMNTNRLHARMGALDAGEGEIRLHIYRLNLLPGEFSVSVAALSEELAEEVFDLKEKVCSFRIKGKPDPSDAKVHLPYRWVIGEVFSPPASNRNFIESVASAGTGSEIKPIGANDPFSVRIGLHVAGTEKAAPDVSILLGEYLVHKSCVMYTLPPGRSVVELQFDPITLLDGEYTFETGLAVESADHSEERHRMNFTVRSKRREGAGLVFMPCAWDVVKVPRKKPGTKPD